MSQLQLLGPLFDNLPIGLVVLDHQGRVLVYNRAEERLASRSREAVLGTSFFLDVAPCMDVKQLSGAFFSNIGQRSFDVTAEMSFPFAHLEEPRDVRVRLCSLIVDDSHYGFMMVEDISLMREVERMREQLQSLLVHDLKNPLAAVLSNLDFLKSTGAVRDSQDALDAVEDSIAAAQRLNRMAVNLLDLSRLEAATMPLRRTSVDAKGLLARVHNDNRAQAKLCRSSITVASGATFDAQIDEDLVVRALDNLVENAIRHARQVTISVEPYDEGVVVRIADNGPGIPEAIRATLFDRYVQVQSAGGSARGHNRGLGLTFVRLVAREHGGDVELACPADGGSIFTVTLPGPASPRARRRTLSRG